MPDGVSISRQFWVLIFAMVLFYVAGYLSACIAWWVSS